MLPRYTILLALYIKHTNRIELHTRYTTIRGDELKWPVDTGPSSVSITEKNEKTTRTL